MQWSSNFVFLKVPSQLADYSLTIFSPVSRTDDKMCNNPKLCAGDAIVAVPGYCAGSPLNVSCGDGGFGVMN